MAYENIFRNIKTKQDFDRQAQEFEARKRARALQEQRALQDLQTGELQQQQLQKQIDTGITGNEPSAVREYRYYSSLDPQAQREYLRVKRSQQLLNLGGTQAVLDPTGGIREQYVVTPTIAQTPGFQAEVAGAQEAARGQERLRFDPQVRAATMQAEARAESEVGLPQTLQQSAMMKDTLNKLIDEKGNLRPGVGDIAGGVGGMQGRQSALFPVTESQRKYQPVVNQIKGQTFLEAYDRLKGGGVITEIEGAKAEQALARLDQAQSDEDFAAALKDLRDVVEAGEQRAMAQAGRDPMGASQRAIQERESDIGRNSMQRENQIEIINPQTNEMFRIPESQLEAAKQDGFMRLR